MRLAHFCLASLLIFSMVRVFAEPGATSSGPYPGATQGMESPEETQFPAQLEQGQGRQFGIPVSGNDEPSGNGEQASLAADSPRQLRLTAEARRALRQQINQARHDIYVSRP
jgi:hypothetical protein